MKEKKQECIPVGCLLSATVAVSRGGGGFYPWGGFSAERGCLGEAYVCVSAKGGCLPGGGGVCPGSVHLPL